MAYKLALFALVWLFADRCAKWLPKINISPLSSGTGTQGCARSQASEMCPPCKISTSILCEPATTSRHPFSGVAASMATLAVFSCRFGGYYLLLLSSSITHSPHAWSHDGGPILAVPLGSAVRADISRFAPEWIVGISLPKRQSSSSLLKVM